MRLFHVDAFTRAAFSGNPAAVCLLDGPADPSWMQQVAAEMNLAETAFVEPRDGGYGLRWFTPMTEVALCGHATLASAHVLLSLGAARRGETIRFESASGLLTARGDGDLITLEFPARPARPAPAPPDLLSALGIASPAWTGRAPEDFLIVVDTEEDVAAVTPDFARLAAVAVRGTIVTAAASRPGADFVSRFFAPAVGVAEDPVTGSAHCTLAPYWTQRLGRPALTGYQASSRGGTVQVRWDGGPVTLAGHAVTVFSATVEAAALPQPPAYRPTA
jgi:PhzF family phenazine biosynthesis protein